MAMRYSVTMRQSLATIASQRQSPRSIAPRVALVAITTPHLLFAASGCVDPPEEAATLLGDTVSNDQPYANSLGAVATYDSAGAIDLGGPFFQSLGSNGRSCFSCHRLDQGMSITPSSIQSRFTATRGTGPRGLVPPTWIGLAAVLVASGLLIPSATPHGPAVAVAIVQGNVPRLGLEFNAQRRAVLDNHVNATLDLANRVQIAICVHDAGLV